MPNYTALGPNEAIGNPITTSAMTRRTTELGNFEERKDLSGNLNDQPRNNGVGDRDLITLRRFSSAKKFLLLISAEDSCLTQLAGANPQSAYLRGADQALVLR